MWSGFTDRELGILGKRSSSSTRATRGSRSRTSAARRRQDHQVDPRRQRARRGALVHRRQDRHLLRQQGLDRPRRRTSTGTRSTSSRSRRSSQDYTQFDGIRCAMPALADTYGLYYNTDHAQGRRLHEPAEDHVRAARHGRQAHQVQPRRQHQGRRASCRCGASTRWRRRTSPRSSARPGPTGDGKSNFAADPNWATMLHLPEEVRRRHRLRQAAPVHLGRRRLASSPRPTCSRPASWR